jgi:hypothetical protein
VLKAVKTRAAKKGQSWDRHHAEAMAIEDMQQIMGWSEKTCPHSMLDSPNLKVADNEAIKVLDKHGLMRAFATTAFTLFTR